jgi:hypothetical protein
MTSVDTELLSLQRDEFSRASGLQQWSSRFQWLVALIGVASVFIDDVIAAYLLTCGSLAVYLAYIAIDIRYRRSRTLAERARRATLVFGGLGGPMSPAERRELLAQFGHARKLSPAASSSFFASDAAHGPARLAEMLEESAFWSAEILAKCTTRTWWTFAVFLLVAIGGLLALPMLAQSVALMGARVVAAMLVLFLSSDLFGAALAYGTAASSARRVVDRLQRVKAEGYPLSDVLVVMCDYNFAVESAPLFLPGVYDSNRTRLNELWSKHKGNARSA